MRFRGLVLACLCTATVAIADEGRIPLHAVTTISAPGQYVVTRPVTAATGPVVTVNASDVSIDLNGFTLTSTTTAATEGVIQLSPTAARIVITNGKLEGGAVNGIYQAAASNAGDLRVNQVQIYVTGTFAYGIQLTGANRFDLLDSVVKVDGSRVVSVTGPVDARLERNSLSITGQPAHTVAVELISLSRAEITSNRISILCSGTMGGISLSGTGGAVVRSNVIDGNCDPGSGISLVNDANLVEQNVIGREFAKRAIDVSSNGNIVRANVLWGGEASGIGGIEVSGSDNAISENRVLEHGGSGSLVFVGGSRNRISRNSLSGSNGAAFGVLVTGTLNSIEDNVISGTGIGLSLGGSSNSYKGNFLRGNTTPVNNTGVGNTDNGGNVL